MDHKLPESKFFTIVKNIKDKIQEENKLEDLLSYLCEQLVLSLECLGVWVGMKEDGGGVKCLAIAGEVSKYQEKVEIRWDDIPFGNGAVGQAIKTGQIQVFEVSSNERYFSWLPEFKKLQIDTWLAIPIISKEDGVVGVFFIYGKNANEFCNENIAVLRAFAEHVSTIIDLERSKELLDKYRLLLESTKDIVLIIEPEGKVVEANQAALKAYGYSREELLSLKIIDLRADLGQKDKQQMKIVKEKGIVFETAHKRKDGSFFPVEVSTVEEEINGWKVLISIVRDISKRKKIEMEYLSTKKEMAAKVSYFATHDILTELPNKAVLTKKLEDKLKRSENNPFAVFFIDIDRFKFINDTYGHSIGDILLIRVAERIKRLLCKEDLLCRYGGDEFVILVNGRENSAEFYKIASRIVNRCSRRFKIRGNELYISVSIGIAIYPDMGKNVDCLLKHASMAMYSAKKKGGNKYQVYLSKEDTQYFKRYSLFGYLNKALQKNEFLLYYQPQLELVTGEIKGVEALIRWFSPLGLINPGDFIPLAEDTGLIIPVGEWVTNTACKQNKKWQELGWIDLRMSINVSAKQFYQPCFVSTLESTLDDTNLDPKSLSIEITESIAMEDFESASRIIRELKNLGIGIAIDDFGTGYSSLNYLVNLDLDFLKIDRSLIKNLHTQGKKKNVVKGIINVAHNLGIKVIAEGVERQEELDFLKDHQCDLVQGFLIGYPLPVRQGVNCFKY